MKILVCARIQPDGEINPFDACAYELALSVPGAEVSLLSMGPLSSEAALLSLTRLGAKTAYLLTDSQFAGADTLATAYTLSLAVKKLAPDYVFCGRQTLVGDTGQTAIMLSQKTGFDLITNVMGLLDITDKQISCKTRESDSVKADSPALITVERINTLRFPSIRSKTGEVVTLSATDIGADIEKCGFSGSPTRVIETKENTSGRRKCVYIEPADLRGIISNALKRTRQPNFTEKSEKRIGKVIAVTAAVLDYAKSVSDNIIVFDEVNADVVISKIKAEKPDAVLFGSDYLSKRVSALVAARLDLGLCADCTALDTDGENLYMIRPALSGSVMAKIVSRVKPAMATVRTAVSSSDIVVTAGFGVADKLDTVRSFADSINATLGATRKAVDNGILPYDLQIGLTGKTVSPAVYIAIGVSGAVHHIAGMDKSGVIIAINPDKNAPIFDYADYGIISDFNNNFLEVKNELR
ncbi:MAG: FAD-binding protein [Clostridia bacterium]|nr:FAD-binding protein [Clostridia bacterium]